MKWIKYFIFSIVSFLLIGRISWINNEVRVENKIVSKYIQIQNNISDTQLRFRDIHFFKEQFKEEYPDEEIVDNKVKEILIELKINLKKIKLENEFMYHKISEINKLSTLEQSIEYFKDDIVLNQIETERSKVIFHIRKINKIKDYLFYILIFLIVVSLLIEIKIIKNESVKISNYLNNILYKRYEFNISKSKLPYMNEIVGEISNIKENLKILDEIISVALKGYSIKDSLEELYKNEKFREYIEFERIGFATVEENFFVAGISINKMSELKLKRGFKIRSEESRSLRNIITNREIRILNDLELYYKANPNSVSTKLILEEGFLSNLTVPLYKTDGKIIGILFFSSKNKNTYKEIDKLKISSIVEIISYIFEKNMLIEDLITNSVLTFVKLVEGKDPETSLHIDRMAYYSKVIAKHLARNPKYSEKIDYYFIDDIYKYAPLHDIGKVGIADKILLKPGKLTEEEFEKMKDHTKIGAKILSYYQNNLRKYDLSLYNMAVQIAVGHHEKWDGSGYPNNLKGEKISLVARIIAISDVFDALSSKRVYKKAYSFDKSIEMVNELSGTHFDPDVVEAFNNSIEEIEEIYEKMKEV